MGIELTPNLCSPPGFQTSPSPRLSASLSHFWSISLHYGIAFWGNLGHIVWFSALRQRSPTFLTPGTGFSRKMIFSTDWGWGFQDDASMLHLFCTLFLLFLYQLQLRSLGIRSQRLGTSTLRAESRGFIFWSLP